MGRTSSEGTSPASRMNYASLVKAISSATTELQSRAAAAVNQSLVVRIRMVFPHPANWDTRGIKPETIRNYPRSNPARNLNGVVEK